MLKVSRVILVAQFGAIELAVAEVEEFLDVRGPEIVALDRRDDVPAGRINPRCT